MGIVYNQLVDSLERRRDDFNARSTPDLTSGFATVSNQRELDLMAEQKSIQTSVLELGPYLCAWRSCKVSSSHNLEESEQPLLETLNLRNEHGPHAILAIPRRE